MTSQDFEERITDSEIRTIQKRLEEQKIKNYIAVVNPLLFYKYGFKLYLIFSEVKGFTSAGKNITDLCSEKTWKNRLSVYGLFGDKDFIFILLGTEEEKEFLSRWLRKKFNSRVGDIAVEDFHHFMRFPVARTRKVDLKKFAKYLPQLALDPRKLNEEEIETLTKSGILLGSSILEKYYKNMPIKAFVAVRFSKKAENQKIAAFVGTIMRTAHAYIRNNLVSIYNGAPTEVEFGLVFEFDVDDFYSLDDITNLFYDMAPMMETETETYIVSSCINNVMPYIAVDEQARIFGMIDNLPKDLKEKFEQLTTVYKAKVISILDYICKYDFSIIEKKDFKEYIDGITGSVLDASISTNALAYKNCATNCGVLLEGVIKESFRKRKKKLWPGKTRSQLMGLLQDKLHLKQKTNPMDLPLGKLILFMKSWDKYIPEHRFFFENEANDYEKLHDVSVIRNSIGAHWGEMEFSRVERDTLWVMDCTLYLFDKMYQREFLTKSQKLSHEIDHAFGESDVFISHASEDKDEIVRSLADALRSKDLEVWYDEFTLTLGDRLEESIEFGLANSRFGVVVLSPAFFAKKWPRRELKALAEKEKGGKKVILPVWHNVDREYIARFSPILANRISVSTKQGLKKVVDEILKAISKARVQAR